MNNSMIRIWSRVLVLAGTALFLGAGCLATTGSSAAHREANLREDSELVKEKMRRLEGDIESLSMQIEQLSQDLRRIQANSASAAETQTAPLRSTLSTVEDRVHTLERQRETDKQEILDSVSLTVATLINEATPPSRPVNRQSPAPTGYGFEHIVQSGETLSQIAKAYGTTVSAIQKANNLKNADTLHIGQKLFIPE